MPDQPTVYQYGFDREEYCVFEINGEEYRIRKFDAQTGLKTARMLLRSMTRLPQGEDLPRVFFSLMVRALSDEEIDRLTQWSLRACEKRLKAGWTAVIDSAGHYQVPELEFDPAAVFVILSRAVAFGVGGFFTALSSILK